MELLYYGMSLIGSSHLKRNIGCQDSNKMVLLSNGWVVAAVADGVGSAKHSDIASGIAVDTVIEICNNHIGEQTKLNDVKEIILEAYKKAEERIEEYVKSHNDDIFDYDTTLSMVVYDGENLVYGHVGDGGIIGLTNEGRYEKITLPQKAEDGICVIPLRAGQDFWVIDEAKGKYASALLTTDGMYDTFYPYLLRENNPDIYVPLIRFFMDNNVLFATADNIKDIEISRMQYMQSEAYASVSDDKTIAVVINPDIKPELQDDSYYSEPDWEKLQLEWNRKAYPQLYKKDN